MERAKGYPGAFALEPSRDTTVPREPRLESIQLFQERMVSVVAACERRAKSRTSAYHRFVVRPIPFPIFLKSRIGFREVDRFRSANTIQTCRILTDIQPRAGSTSGKHSKRVTFLLVAGGQNKGRSQMPRPASSLPVQGEATGSIFVTR